LQQPGAKHETGTHILNGGAGTTGPRWRRPCLGHLTVQSEL